MRFEELKKRHIISSLEILIDENASTLNRRCLHYYRCKNMTSMPWFRAMGKLNMTERSDGDDKRIQHGQGVVSH